MAGTTANFSIRLSEETKVKVDALAKVLGRPRNYVIAEAVERYITEESWQLGEIQAGIAEDDAGLGIAHNDVMRDAYALIERAEREQSS